MSGFDKPEEQVDWGLINQVLAHEQNVANPCQEEVNQ